MPPLNEDPTRTGIQVIARAAALLRALKDTPAGLSLGQLGDRTALPRSTVQRIVQALAEERLVITSPLGGVRLGPELHAMAGAAHSTTTERVRPFLTALTEATGETVDLSVLRNGRMIFLDQVQGTHRLRTVSSVGEVFPLTTPANGRACLALLPESEARALARAEWTRTGTAPDWPDFSARLARIRETGLAEDDGDHSPGISALGFAFADLHGTLHAISVPIPSSRYPAQKVHVAAALQRLRAELARVFAV